MFAVVGCVLRDDTKEVIVVKDKHRSVGQPTPLESSGGVNSKNTHCRKWYHQGKITSVSSLL